MDVSIIVPVFNEQDNVLPLHEELTAEMTRLGRSYEVLYIDDGSRDDTAERLLRIAGGDARVRVVRFRRNHGQTAAMQAGIDHASGKVLVFLDGDLQNDPADVPRMLDALDESVDLVHGWRKRRRDRFWDRRLPSTIANWVIARVTRFPVHDLGCTLKVMRREIASELELYGEMHRFIPILAHQRGARCVEVETHHRPRKNGRTTYGISRTLRVLLDLITVKFLLDYFPSPMKFFGLAAVGCACVAGASALAVGWMKIRHGVDMTGNPLLLLLVLSTMVAVQFLSLGVLGEVGARTYFQAAARRAYSIRSLTNFPGDSVQRAAFRAPSVRTAHRLVDQARI